jgi:hypothetical protein
VLSVLLAISLTGIAEAHVCHSPMSVGELAYSYLFSQSLYICALEATDCCMLVPGRTCMGSIKCHMAYIDNRGCALKLLIILAHGVISTMGRLATQVQPVELEKYTTGDMAYSLSETLD